MSPLLELLETPARQAAVESQTAHRPWPVPDEPWVMAQTWDDLLFAHWRVAAEDVAQLVPQGLEVDQHEGSAWVGVTPFVLTGFRLRGTVPLPWLSTFPELNVRTYVTAEDKPGIWFFSLDAASRLAVEGARRAYKLPYYHAEMSARRRGGAVEYSSRRLDGGGESFAGAYRPTGNTFDAEPGSLEWFLTERYCLYAVDRGRLHRAEIQHPPWPLQDARLDLAESSMAPHGIELESAPLCHYARRQDVLIWPLRPVAS
jgi:uncharacterized protein YqjF (DUF2071 family)